MSWGGCLAEVLHPKSRLQTACRGGREVKFLALVTASRLVGVIGERYVRSGHGAPGGKMSSGRRRLGHPSSRSCRGEYEASPKRTRGDKSQVHSEGRDVLAVFS